MWHKCLENFFFLAFGIMNGLRKKSSKLWKKNEFIPIHMSGFKTLPKLHYTQLSETKGSMKGLTNECLKGKAMERMRGRKKKKTKKHWTSESKEGQRAWTACCNNSRLGLWLIWKCWSQWTRERTAMELEVTRDNCSEIRLTLAKRWSPRSVVLVLSVTARASLWKQPQG